MTIQRYKRGLIDKGNSDKLLLPFVYIPRLKMCNQDTGLLSAIYCKQKEKSSRHQDFQGKDFHKRSYLAFYYVHEDLG